MASIPPSRFNDYRVESDTPLSADVFNGIFNDLAKRMSAIEVKGATFDDLENEGIGVALSRINDVQAPAVANLTTLIAAANAFLTQVKANAIGASIIATDSNNRFISDAQLVEVNAIPALSAALSALQAKPSNEGRNFFFSTM